MLIKGIRKKKSGQVFPKTLLSTAQEPPGLEGCQCPRHLKCEVGVAE